MADPVASIGKVIVKHLPTNEDLIGCIKKICVENGIRCGQILSVIGSIRHLTIECIVVSDENESGLTVMILLQTYLNQSVSITDASR